jgi:uncharacterized protein YukE
MGLLDANAPQMFTSHASFHDQAVQFNSTVSQAENTAVAAQAFHQGESSVAFQQAHMQFVEAGTKLQQLLTLAGNNIGEGAQTYVTQDGAGATDMAHTAGMLPTSMPGLA